MSSETDPGAEWLLDPVDPHAIARSRPNTDEKYHQFTLLTIVRTLVDLGDEEFSTDTAASVARATQLYEVALDLLDKPVLTQLEDPCETIGTRLDQYLPEVDESEPDRVYHKRVRDEVKTVVESVDAYEKRVEVVEAVGEAVMAPRPPVGRIVTGTRLIDRSEASETTGAAIAGEEESW